MNGIRRGFLVAGAAVVLLAPEARAQAVAFQPVVGALPNGPILNVTPTVSVDRRYVRLGVNAQFLAVEGFNTSLVPAAVGGGPGGPGAVGGGAFLAGMNGVIGPATGMDFMSMPAGPVAGFRGDPLIDGAIMSGPGGMADGPQIRRAIPRAGRRGEGRPGRAERQGQGKGEGEGEANRRNDVLEGKWEVPSGDDRDEGSGVAGERLRRDHDPERLLQARRGEPGPARPAPPLAGVPGRAEDPLRALGDIFATIRGDEAAVLYVVGRMEIDPEIAEAVEELDRSGWSVVVASAGCDWYIRRLLSGLEGRVEVHSNPGRFEAGRGLLMELPTASPYFCDQIGVNKAAIVLCAAIEAGRTVAFAGDGFPDLDAAMLVPPDRRFARGDLADSLRERGEAFRPFNRWSDIARALVGSGAPA